MAPAPTVAEPWAIIRREESPTNQEHWRQFRDGTNSLHPSCGATTPTPPEWVEERTVTYLEDMRDRARARNNSRRDRRGRNRRGMPRQEGRRDRNQERAREEARRQRDREDRANRDRRGPKRK